MYNLDSGEFWLLNGSLKYYTILQLQMFCQISEKLNEITYVQTFMTLQNKNADAVSKVNRFMSQKKREFTCSR